jgi:hypothetical protein
MSDAAKSENAATAAIDGFSIRDSFFVLSEGVINLIATCLY